MPGMTSLGNFGRAGHAGARWVDRRAGWLLCPCPLPQPEPGSPPGLWLGGQAPRWVWSWQSPSMTHHCSIAWLSVTSIQV